MAQTFKCTYCGKANEISEAFAHQIEEEVLASTKSKHKEEIEKATREAELRASKKIESDFELKIKELKNAELDEKERNKKFQDQILALTKELRKIRQEREDDKIVLQKKLADEEEKIRQDAHKKADEEHELKDKEKDKMLNDLKKALEEAKRKAQQGSQQTQGEVMELELEEILRREFPSDEISEVKKGQRGADVVQEVIDKKGRKCGTILWESKNAVWSNSWIGKLKDDQRQIKAELAVLATANPPDGIKTFAYRDGVWIVDRKMVSALALALRFDIVRINYERLANVGKNEKTEVLYQYITSTEFQLRIEAITEAFGNLQNEMEREKRWFNTKWARQEKELRKVLDHTHGMYGDLQGVIGKSLPEIKTLELEGGDEYAR